MKIIVRSTLSLILAFGFVGPVAAENIKDVMATLEIPFQTATAAGQAVHDVETKFDQESTIASLEQTQTGSGRVMLRFDRIDPNKVPLVSFRWEYDLPTRQEIVSDGRTIWVYIPENNQVIESNISEVSEARPEDPLTFLTGLGNLSRDFSVRWGSPDRDAENNYVVDLTPRRTTATLNHLTVVVDRRAVQEYLNGNTGRTFPIRETTATDPNGNITRIVFNQQLMKLNRGLSPSLFRYIKPAGVEVVRPGGGQMGY
jgi:outer membrane lipoprotein carrier protein